MNEIEKLVSEPSTDLAALLSLHQGRHSNFQIDHFIVAKSAGTPWGRLKQAVRELHARAVNLRQQYRQREHLNEEVWKASSQRDRANVEDNLSELVRDIAEQEREFTRFQKLAEKYKAIVGDVTPERADELEQETWLDTIKRRMAVEYMTRGQVSSETVEILMCLPRAMRTALDLGDKTMPDRVVKWFRDLDDESVVITHKPQREIGASD